MFASFLWLSVIKDFNNGNKSKDRRKITQF